MVDYDELRSEYIRCYQDKSRIYMIQSYLKTFDGTQGKDVAFKLFPRQQLLCKALGEEDYSVATTKYRQAGISTVTSAFITCEACLASKDAPITVLIVGNTLDLAQQMLFKVKNFLLQLPLWFWGEDAYDENDSTIDITQPPVNPKQVWEKCNGKEIILNNGSKIYARSSGPNAARGISACNIVCFDECAFIENGNLVYESCLPTTSSVNGKIVFISTPNGKDPLYYETCRRAKLKGTKDWNAFNLVEMFWYQDPRYNRRLEWTKKDETTGELLVDKDPIINDKGNVEYNEKRWEKLKEDGWKPRSPWYIKMCQQFNNDSQKIAQELDVSFLGSASNVVEPEFIEMQQTLNVREPIYQDNIIEDTWIWKEPIEGHRYLCACDNSRGDSADRTAIEIIDLDGVDEQTGEPIIEQVLEYQGKKTGDDVGEMVYQYASAYGNAYVVVECIGGAGDATVLQLQRLNYKNLYYDDADLNKYTMQREISTLKPSNDGKLPGFHSNAVRFQMLTHFANLVKTNQFKVRSKRVIAELDTWIYKGPAARIDHQDGAHDDTLTCLAMGLFVAKYSLDKLQEAKSRDKARLSAMICAAKNLPSIIPQKEKHNTEVLITPKYNMPFYTNASIRNNTNDPYGSLRWLIV